MGKTTSFVASALILQLVCCSHGQVVLTDIPEGQYLLPVGGPNEIVPEAHKQRNLQTAVSFMRRVASGEIPLNLLTTFIGGGVPPVPTLIPEWAHDIEGQIRPLGIYDTFEKSAEYWFVMPRIVVIRAAISLGLSYYSQQTQQDPSLPVWDGGKFFIKELFADSNMVSFKLILHLTINRNLTFSEPWINEATFELSGTYYFNREGLICGYDVNAPSFSAMWAGIDPLREAGFPSQQELNEVPDSPFKAAYLPLPGVGTWLEEICDVATGSMCLPITGTKFYEDKADCMEKLGKKREGTYDDIDQDTLTCRALHRLLVPSRPEGHCMHLAPDLAEKDGGVCIDRDSAPYNARQFQCGYEDVALTPSLSVRPAEGAYVHPGYPYTLEDFALTDPVTVAEEALTEKTGCYGGSA